MKRIKMSEGGGSEKCNENDKNLFVCTTEKLIINIISFHFTFLQHFRVCAFVCVFVVLLCMNMKSCRVPCHSDLGLFLWETITVWRSFVYVFVFVINIKMFFSFLFSHFSPSHSCCTFCNTSLDYFLNNSCFPFPFYDCYVDYMNFSFFFGRNRKIIKTKLKFGVAAFLILTIFFCDIRIQNMKWKTHYNFIIIIFVIRRKWELKVICS